LIKLPIGGSSGQLLVNFSQSKHRIVRFQENLDSRVTRRFAPLGWTYGPLYRASRGQTSQEMVSEQGFCRAGRIRTADLLTPRQGSSISKVLVTASRKQNR
jgi:hypothetical protein